METHWSQRDYFGQTTVHPLGLAILLVLGTIMLLVPRRLAILPPLILACFVAGAQRVVIADLDFTFLRLMVLFGCARIAMRGEYQGFRWKTMDTVFVSYVGTTVVAYALLWGFDVGKMIYRCGQAYDAVGMYFIARCLIRDWEDLRRLGLYAAYLALPVSFFFAIEYATGRNLFSVFGGVGEYSIVRAGRLRCQGAFAHPILAGTFWAVLLPLIGALWWQGPKSRLWAVLGVFCSLVIIFACAASTPVMGVAIAMVGGATFMMRYRMRALRWSLLAMLVVVHFIREKPVWHLMARVSAIKGSTGYHRYRLVDQAINRFDEWWFIGSKSNAHWGFGLDDVTNQYVAEALKGGLATLTLLVVLIAIGFRGIGRLWRTAPRDKRCLALAWGLGVALLVHAASFWGISYFGQINFVWYTTLAAIASMTPVAARAGARQVRPQRRPALPPPAQPMPMPALPHGLARQ